MAAGICPVLHQTVEAFRKWDGRRCPFNTLSVTVAFPWEDSVPARAGKRWKTTDSKFDGKRRFDSAMSLGDA
jgi:hypothetical protein